MGRVAHRKPPAPTPTGVDWSTCASAVREYDSSIVEAWRRDMDNSITFAALFWTVINAAFFSSLIISLNAVVMATLVKQWLAEYTWALESRSGSSQEILALRQVRFNGLNKWKLPQIIDYLPLQIIFAVFLFFAGVAYLAWTLDVVVGVIASVLVAASGMFFIITRGGFPSGIDALHWIHSVLASWDPKLFPSIWNCAVSLDSLSLAANAVCTLYRHTASHTVGDKNMFTIKHGKAFCKDIPHGYALLVTGHKALLKAFPSRDRPAAFTPAIPHALVDYALFLASTMERVPYASDNIQAGELLDALLCLLGLFDPQITPLAFMMPSERRVFDERLLLLLSEAFGNSTGWIDYLKEDKGVLLFQTTLSGCSDTNSDAFPFLSALSICSTPPVSRPVQ
ncbi:hypothetical protein B0H17DRAFT_1205523 [Mycena rosella]|uniref:DUF6535 domain-containing protein n=1 Tax=Mycena rosella TaxID=1033263 RepID=A0AAD7D7C3_MYCRO|nr:hypothetical protein B0H17DRAFT_1205523 [Mycena rosella]